MVSTHKMLLLAIALQLLFGFILTAVHTPSTFPTSEFNQLEEYRMNLEGRITNVDEQYSRDVNSIAGSGDVGINALPLAGSFVDIFLNGFTLPYVNQPDASYLEQMILIGLRIYHLLILLYFSMEVFMFFLSKKQS